MRTMQKEELIRSNAFTADRFHPVEEMGKGKTRASCINLEGWANLHVSCGASAYAGSSVLLEPL